MSGQQYWKLERSKHKGFEAHLLNRNLESTATPVDFAHINFQMGHWIPRKLHRSVWHDCINNRNHTLYI